MLMHDGLILDLTPQDFIFKAVIFVVVFFIAFLIEHFAVKLSKKALDSSKLPSASIFVNIIRGIIWAFAILAVLQPVFGIQPTAFVTALGVTSIAFSFIFENKNLQKTQKKAYQIAVLCCKGTDNDFSEQSSFIRKLNITTQKKAYQIAVLC